MTTPVDLVVIGGGIAGAALAGALAAPPDPPPINGKVLSPR